MRLEGTVQKAWGSEFIWATNDKYCGKFLHFNSGAQCSMHFHSEKEETWYVLSGRFEVRWIDTTSAQEKWTNLQSGDVWHNKPLMPHKLICVEQGTVIEVSTPDSVEDNYRVQPGDGQAGVSIMDNTAAF